jgi:hypothetical protein
MSDEKPAVNIPALVIRVRPDGKGVTVQGPLQDKLVCWRMLTDAAVVIINYEERKIVVPDLVANDSILRVN